MEIADKTMGATDQTRVEVETSSVQKEVVLKVEGLYKKFCRNLKKSMIYGMLDIIKGFLGIKPDHSSLRKDEFWALQDINFELRENEILGIIGANGSGKSTLLRLLTGIYPPDQGKITLHGKVGGIIALGAGMHPHLTGRENIYLNGTILGMSKAELDAKFDEIVEFAELGEFLEAPLSTYSSGMKVRLGFAVAVHCEPEILLVDEVLAVGDLSFQNKCMRKLREIREKAKAVIFISHSMQNIEMLCDRVVVMDKGSLIIANNVKEGIMLYQDLQEQVPTTLEIARDGSYHLSDIRLTSLEPMIKRALADDMGDKILCRVHIANHSNLDKKVILTIAIRNIYLNNLVWYVTGDNGSQKSYTVKPGDNILVVDFGILPLSNGEYHFVGTLRDDETLEVLSKNNLRSNALLIKSRNNTRALLSPTIKIEVQ